jgi:hypothetical protein
VVMANVYFVKSGEVHGEKFVADKPLDFCFDVLGLRVWKWHSPLGRNGPFILGTNEDSKSYVVVEVTREDLTTKRLDCETGYYVLDIDVTKGGNLLMNH